MKPFNSLWNRFHSYMAELPRKIRVFRMSRGKTQDYQRYLRTQIERTLVQNKRNSNLVSSALIDKLLETAQPEANASILCIGCRNTAELDYFKAKGYPHVIGIDLVSENPDILVMDMHAMKFSDSQYDVVYTSHSLEHSYEVGKVIGEIVRVARPGALVVVEVPVHYETRGADLVDFGGPDNLLEAFEPHVDRVLLSEEHPARSDANAHGTAIARAIFTVQK